MRSALFPVISVLTGMALAQTGDGRLPIGMNLHTVAYYTTELMFYDVAKTLGGGNAGYDGPGTGGWMTRHADSLSQWDTRRIAEIPLDSNGYPLEIPYNGMIVFALFSNMYPPGRYLVLYDGEGDIDIADTRDGGTAILESSPGRILIDYSGNGLEGAGFTGNHNLLYINRSEAGNPVRNIRIVPEHGEQSYRNTLFYPPYLDSLRRFHAIRPMQTIGTNDNHFVNPADLEDQSPIQDAQHPVFSGRMSWSQRRKTTDFTQESNGGKGTAYEYLIELSNQAGVDLWITFPHTVDDAYIRNLARLVKDSLDPSLKIYAEYSNEVWNPDHPYPQHVWVNANAPGAADSIRQALAAIGDSGVVMPEKYGYMHRRTCDIWSSVFSGADRSRLVCVAGGFQGNAETTRRMLAWLQPRGGIDAVALAAYFSISEEDRPGLNAAPASVDSVLARAAGNMRGESMQGVLANVAVAREFNVPYLVYEGGSGLTLLGEDEAHRQAMWDAHRHPRMGELYGEWLRLHAGDSVGCGLFMAYNYVSKLDWDYGGYGHLEYPGQPASEAPKWLALMEALEPRAETPTRVAPEPLAATKPRILAGRGSILIQGPGLHGTVAVHLADGRRVASLTVRGGSARAGNLSPGVYFLRLSGLPGTYPVSVL